MKVKILCSLVVQVCQLKVEFLILEVRTVYIISNINNLTPDNCENCIKISLSRRSRVDITGGALDIRRQKLYHISRRICIVFRSVTSLKKYETVAAALISDIKSGKYPRGSALPTEERLTLMYGVSRQTVRRALNFVTVEHADSVIETALALPVTAAPEAKPAKKAVLPVPQSPVEPQTGIRQ